MLLGHCALPFVILDKRVVAFHAAHCSSSGAFCKITLSVPVLKALEGAPSARELQGWGGRAEEGWGCIGGDGGKQHKLQETRDLR